MSWALNLILVLAKLVIPIYRTVSPGTPLIVLVIVEGQAGAAKLSVLSVHVPLSPNLYHNLTKLAKVAWVLASTVTVNVVIAGYPLYCNAFVTCDKFVILPAYVELNLDTSDNDFNVLKSVELAAELAPPSTIAPWIVVLLVPNILKSPLIGTVIMSFLI